MPSKTKTLVAPALGSVKSIPVGGIQNDPLRRQLAAVISAASGAGGESDAGPANKPIFDAVAALESIQQLRWGMCDEFHANMVQLDLQSSNEALIVENEKPEVRQKRLDVARRAMTIGLGDKFRDEFWRRVEPFLDAGERVERTIAKAEADFESPFAALKAGDKRALIDVMKDNELRADVAARPIAETLKALHRSNTAGDRGVLDRLVPIAQTRAQALLRMAPNDLARAEVPGGLFRGADDDTLKNAREAAMKVLAFAASWKESGRPAWIAVARSCWQMLDEPRRMLVGPHADFLKPAVLGIKDSGDTARISAVKWLDWRTVDPTCHVRFLSWPLKVGGWSAPVAQDHRVGAEPGAVVRQQAGVPFVLYGGASSPRPTAGR